MLERTAIAIEESARPKLQAEFIGFTPDQQEVVSSQMEATLLPLKNIHEMVYTPNQKGEEDILGSFEPYDGRYRLYKSLEGLPPVAQQGTIIHEISHSDSPLYPQNEGLYQSREKFAAAREHVIAVANQSVITGKYLNGYQDALHRQLEAGDIEPGRFIEETYAIMMELRFTNPNHLKQVEAAQMSAVRKLNEKNPNSPIKPVQFMTSEIDAKRGNLAGVDRTISALIPQLKSKDDIDRHVTKLRQDLIAKGKPILSNRQAQLAA